MDLVELALAASGGAEQPQRQMRFAGGVPKLMWIHHDASVLEGQYGELMVALMAEGFEAHALGHGEEALELLAARGVKVRHLPDAASNPGALLGAAILAQSYMIEQVPFMVHGMEGALGLWGALAGRRAGAMTSVLSVGVVGGALTQALIDAGLGAKLEPLARRQIQGWVANSAEALRQLERLGWLGEGAVAEIIEGGCGVAVDRFEPLRVGAPSQSRQRLGLPEHWRVCFGYKGRLSRAAGALDVLYCAERLASERPELGWLIEVQDAQSASPELKRRFEALAERGIVRFYVPEPKALDEVFFGAIDALYAPSRQEAPQAVLLEAGATARPSLAYATQASSSVIKPGETGALVDLNGCEHALEVLRTWAAQPASLFAMGKAARSFVAMRFDRVDQVRQHMAFYDLCMSRALKPKQA